jgi:outer membrane lipoprotein SlyB
VETELGGLLGHRVGNGNGKTVATLLAAAGGAYAGHSAEKNMQKVTVYDVRVRMHDGSLRNM